MAWAALSVMALLISGLDYEVTIPLFVLNLLVVVWRASRNESLRLGIRSNLGWAVAVISNCVAFISLLIFKAKKVVRFHGDSVTLSWVKYVVRGAVKVHFIDYGIRLPLIVYRAARLSPD